MNENNQWIKKENEENNVKWKWRNEKNNEKVMSK